MEKKTITEKITTNLWFDKQAEDAADFYLSVFKNGSKGRITYYGTEGYEIHGMKEGAVMTVEFSLEGREFIGLNGGPLFKFNESISFIINCENQDEIDYYWEKLNEGGDPNAQACGWLRDKFGVSWQVEPVILADMLHDGDKEKAARVMAAMLKMKKIDIAKLEEAYRQ